MLQKSEKIISNLASTLSAIGIIAVTSIIFINVVLRYIFNSGMVWVEEFTRYIMMWVTFIGASLAVKNDMHVSMDAVFNVLPMGIKRIMRIIIYAIAGITTISIIILGIAYTHSLIKTHQVSIALDWFPMWFVVICVPIGCVFMAMFYWRLALNNVIENKYVQNLEVGEDK